MLWEEKPGLYRQPPTSEVFATRTQDDGLTTVQFGDGETGAPVPTGQSNIVATYRVGSGVAGRVPARSLSAALDRPPGLRGVVNPLAARGGADQERAEDARENAPATVRTFGRAGLTRGLLGPRPVDGRGGEGTGGVGLGRPRAEPST